MAYANSGALLISLEKAMSSATLNVQGALMQVFNMIKLPLKRDLNMILLQPQTVHNPTIIFSSLLLEKDFQFKVNQTLLWCLRISQSLFGFDLSHSTRQVISSTFTIEYRSEQSAQLKECSMLIEREQAPILSPLPTLMMLSKELR